MAGRGGAVGDGFDVHGYLRCNFTMHFRQILTFAWVYSTVQNPEKIPPGRQSGSNFGWDSGGTSDQGAGLRSRRGTSAPPLTAGPARIERGTTSTACSPVGRPLTVPSTHPDPARGWPRTCPAEHHQPTPARVQSANRPLNVPAAVRRETVAPPRSRRSSSPARPGPRARPRKGRRCRQVASATPGSACRQWNHAP